MIIGRETYSGMRMYRSKNPLIYIFYYKNTRDEEYLKKALEGINEEYIEYENDD